MSDLIIDGKPEGRIVSLDFETCGLDRSSGPDRTAITIGSFDVSGEMTCYFYDPGLFAEYSRGDVELTAMLRDFFDQPVPPPLWKRMLRKAAWVVIALALLTLSTGAH